MRLSIKKREANMKRVTRFLSRERGAGSASPRPDSASAARPRSGSARGAAGVSSENLEDLVTSERGGPVVRMPTTA